MYFEMFQRLKQYEAQHPGEVEALTREAAAKLEAPKGEVSTYEYLYGNPVSGSAGGTVHI